MLRLKRKQKKLIENPEFIPNSSIDYMRLLQYTIKKGKKLTLETMFRKSLISWIKTNQNKDFEVILKKAFLNTTPRVSVKTKRKGSRNIYIPIKIFKVRSNFLAAKWLLTSALLKKKRNFCEGIFEELIESSLKKSASVRKRQELYKLTSDNLSNIKIRRKPKIKLTSNI